MKPLVLVAPLALSLTLVLSGFLPGQDNPKKEKEKARPKPVKLQGQLTNSDPLDWQQQASYHKIHPIKLKGGFLYDFTINANFPPHIRLEDYRGNIVSFTHQFTGQTSSIEYAPTEDGEYRIVAASIGGNVTGAYTVDVKVRETVFFVNDQLTGKEPLDPARPNCFHKVHEVKLAPGHTYIIHSKTTVNDGYLRLEDSKKNRLAENDDWMDTRNSRIVFTPTKADTYRIIQTTFSGGTTGPYTITITKQ